MRLPLVIAALLATGGTSEAWVGGEGEVAAGAQPRLDRRLVDVPDVRVVHTSSSGEVAAQARWRGLRDADTGVLAQLWGGRVAAPGAVADAVIAERAARAFVAANLSLLAPGGSIDDLVVVANVVDDGKRTVAFHQTWRGLRVVGGQVSVVIARDAIFVAMSDAIPFVAMSLGPQIGDSARAPAPLSRAEAWVARSATASGRASTSTTTAQPRGASTITTTARLGRVVLPIVHHGRVELRLADHVEMRRAPDALGRPGAPSAPEAWDAWDVYVGLDGAPLLRASRVRRATSTLGYDAPVQRPTAARQTFPAREVGLVVDGAPAATDADGGFAWAGTSAATVTPGLVGSRVRVTNQAGPLATAQLAATDGQPTTWSYATDEQADAQLAAFVHAGIAKTKARALMPSLAAWLDQPLDVYVNEPGGACNASSTGDSIHFYAGGAACENTARLADVVYHEFGHSLHSHAIIDGVGAFNPSLSEGLADFFAANITGDPGVGRGFQFDDTPVRDLDPVGFEKVAPDDFSPSQHQSGLIIGGALWDLRRLLIDRHGTTEGISRAERVFVGLMQRAPNISTSYLAALIGDDDDGDLGNGTPDQCDIDYAFARHGLAPADVQITQLGPIAVEGRSLVLPVISPALPACGDRPIVAVELTTHLANGDSIATEMNHVGSEWRGELPGTGQVRFEIEAVFGDLARLHVPNNPADSRYTAFLDDTEEIWCERFDADPAWTQAQTGSPSPWEWAAPRGLAGDPSSGFTGANALGTDLTDDGRYAQVAQTQIATPPIDASGYDEVRLQFRRWLTVEDAHYDQASIDVNGTPLWTNLATADGFVAHLDREWRFVDHDVTEYAGSPITVSWKLASDASRALGGWTIDDVCLVGVGPRPRCGDGVVDDGEDCDDPGGACTDRCTLVEDNGCCSVGGDPRGSLFLGLGVLALVRRRRGARR